MKKYLALLLFLIIAIKAEAQRYALYNTKTQFDAFENPAMKSFTLDSSRKYASNFLIPSFGLNGYNKGPASFSFRKLVQEGVNDTRTLPLNTGEMNTFSEESNIYLFTLRIFRSYKYQKELGFAWQLRSDALFDYSNESLSIFDSYKRFSTTTPYINVFNNNGGQQTYHQFSLTYRENLNKKIAFGGKLSLLSGIAYNSMKVTSSSLIVDPANDRLDIQLNGVYKGSFIKSDELSKSTLLPFKNFGLSASFGTSYTSKSGVFIMVNIKDLGFIRWGSKSHVAEVNINKTINGITGSNSNKLIQEGLLDIGLNNDEQKGFTTLTNAKVDFLISKQFSLYLPSLIISKDLYNLNGNVAFVNTFKFGQFSASAVPTYNFNRLFMVGAQAMFQTPNFEMYLGTDNIGKTYYTTKGIIQHNASIGNGYAGGSVYFGLAFKIGYVVEHPQNMSYMPKIDDDETSFFKRIFSIFKKKPKS